MASEDTPTPTPARPGRLRRWAPVALAAGLLLAASQLVWTWQTWPVRQLLALEAPPAGSVR